MNNRNFKIKLIDALKSRDVFTQQSSNIQLRTRCPYCGDSRKDMHTGHLYLRINPNDNLPIVYNCFKCPAQGILKAEDLELLGIDNIDFKNELKTMNKTSDKLPSGGNIESEDKYFEYKIPEVTNKEKLAYIENRLGYSFNDQELKDIKIITSLKDFLILNKISTITCKPYMAKLVENKYVGFLSNNNSHILFRDITDIENIKWYKYPITEESQGQKIFYSISSSVDIYSKDIININLAEGVLDTLSIAYNLNGISGNSLNIAVCGKFYTNMIKQLIGMGFIGSNIHINIFADRDYTYDTSLEYYKKTLYKYSYLVGEINIFYNILSKDCGVIKNNIKLEKHRI